MTRMARYIGWQAAVVTLLATLVLCALMLLMQSVRLVDMIVANNLPLADFMLLTGLAVPRFLVDLLPVILFGAILFTYHRLAGDNELVAFFAAGYSRRALARPAALLALVCVAAGYVMTLYVYPLAQQQTRDTLEEIRTRWSAAFIREGQFTPVGSHAMVYIAGRDAAGNVTGLFYYDRKTDLTLIAEKGVFLDDAEGPPRLLAYNGSKHFKRDGKTHLLKFNRAVVQIDTGEAAAGGRWMLPEERFLHQLLFPDPDDPADRAYRNLLRVEAHERLLSPLLSLTALAVALSVILRGFHARGRNIRPVLLASGLMLGVYVVQMWSGNGAAKVPALLVVSYVNVLAPVLVWLFFLARDGGRARPLAA